MNDVIFGMRKHYVIFWLIGFVTWWVVAIIFWKWAKNG